MQDLTLLPLRKLDATVPCPSLLSQPHHQCGVFLSFQIGLTHPAARSTVVTSQREEKQMGPSPCSSMWWWREEHTLGPAPTFSAALRVVLCG